MLSISCSQPLAIQLEQTFTITNLSQRSHSSLRQSSHAKRALFLTNLFLKKKIYFWRKIFGNKRYIWHKNTFNVYYCTVPGLGLHNGLDMASGNSFTNHFCLRFQQSRINGFQIANAQECVSSLNKRRRFWFWIDDVVLLWEKSH